MQVREIGGGQLTLRTTLAVRESDVADAVHVSLWKGDNIATRKVVDFECYSPS